MGKHSATVIWQRDSQPFLDNRYKRAHEWQFDGGIRVPASSSPQILPPPLSLVEAIDPEEAFVAALSSCHMLFFLAIAAKRQILVDSYRDDAEGLLAVIDGRQRITEVILRPEVAVAPGTLMPDSVLADMHDLAHHDCYLANSVTCKIRCEPVR